MSYLRQMQKVGCFLRITVAVAAATALVDLQPTFADAGAAVPWLGITFETGSQFGARILDVHPGTAAAAAGLQPGDEITAVGTVSILPTTELWRVVSSHRIGKRLPITFLRDGQRHQVAPKLTARPAADEIVYQRLIDQWLPALDLVDRQGAKVAPTELRRPLTWVIFDARCETCATTAAELAEPGGELSTARAEAAASLRVVLVGARDETDAYLARVPITSTVWRLERSESRGAGLDPGRRLLSGLDPRTDGVVVVASHTGEVRFATALSAGDALRDGANTAISRAMLEWRQAR